MMNLLPLISSAGSSSNDDESACPSLSFTQRLTGFGVCTGLGNLVAKRKILMIIFNI